MTRLKLIRYALALMMIGLMVGVSQWLEQPEVLFPEMAALALGLWVADKRIWLVSRPMLVILMTVCAVFGVLLVRYSPFPMLINVAISFVFTSLSLIITRTTLVPVTSAAMLPLLFGTDSLVYPLSVFIMCIIVVAGQWLLEKSALRQVIISGKKATHKGHNPKHWTKLLLYVLLIAALPLYIGKPLFIVPPLIVMFIEFSSSAAGFRNRPFQVYLLVVIAATVGAIFQYYLHIVLGVSEAYTALLLSVCVFILFEIVGKLFVPASAIALVPMIIPESEVLAYPFQIAVGAAVFLFAAMFFFQKCYRWKRAHLVICFVPGFVRAKMDRPKRKERQAALLPQVSQNNIYRP
ncbi:HPP family protein [Chitinophaga agrisoli]|uniref:HPP family protein n=1 Tax=Chitinophaga agrisoli TaxID=2607653 RepID=A0A5B2VKX8_9BACT|nr:HPP family protein [Chitinophaga agrisoli]KAA2239358.1 HPP family protein [Chitinophaga agrisoli]